MEEKEPTKQDTNQDEARENTEEIEDKDLDQARGGIISRVTTDSTYKYK